MAESGTECSTVCVFTILLQAHSEILSCFYTYALENVKIFSKQPLEKVLCHSRLIFFLAITTGPSTETNKTLSFMVLKSG